MGSLIFADISGYLGRLDYRGYGDGTYLTRDGMFLIVMQIRTFSQGPAHLNIKLRTLSTSAAVSTPCTPSLSSPSHLLRAVRFHLP